MNEKTPGAIIFGTIDQDPYLNELYDNILYNYSIKLFGIASRRELKSINIDDALRFADLLSKSNHPKKCDDHKIWSQEIVALLKYIYTNHPSIEYYLGSVLSNTGNYLGKENQTPNYTSKNLLERFYAKFAEDIMSIPAVPNQRFLRSQKNIYERLSDQCLSYSAPTSMGKSFVMRMFIKKKIIDDAQLNFALIVPTKALINEVAHKINEDLKENLVPKNYKIVTSPGSIFLKKNHNFIFVLTPERLLYLLISYPNIIINYLFIDEAHKISSKDSRSPFYYKTIDALSRKEPIPHIVFASPNIPNPDVYLKLINYSDAEENALATKFSPVSQMKYFIDYPSKKIFLYNKRTEELSLLVRIRSDPQISIIKIIDLIGKGCKNIIYCRSKDKAIEMARAFAEGKPDLSNDKNLMKLASDISYEIHGDCYLASLIRKGIGYHVGYLPASIRLRIEELYKEGAITTLFCTSTLVEGVNLPADNLFITSYKNGRPTMSDVDFANLVGRVGRIEYNLYGNVFLTRMEDNRDNKVEEFQKFLKGRVPEQKLSIVELTDIQKQIIIGCLKQGNMEFPKTSDGQTEENYQLMRKFAIILVRDIIKNVNSVVKQEFSDFLKDGAEEQIRIAFNTNMDKFDDDINISVDQTESLSEAIKGGLCYPNLTDDGFISHSDIMDFLNRLCKIFKWELYEKPTLGKLCKNFEIHQQCNEAPACYYCRKKEPHKQLSLYAVILCKWIQGHGLNWIIAETIEHKRQNPKNAIQLPNKTLIDFDYTSKEHKNIVIAETLDVIESIILFRISNYFLKFSTEFKKINGPDSLKKDWYEYVEYGTTNDLSIFFQKSGLLREVVNYIKDNDYYVKIPGGEYKIKNSIMQCGKESVLREINDLYYNAPELFID